MENWWKLSFNYHQIPTLSVPLQKAPWIPLFLHPPMGEISMFLKLAQIEMSRGMIKPTKCHMSPAKTQISLGFPQSDQSLHCLHEEAFHPWLSLECTAKTGQTGWIVRLIRFFAGRVWFCWALAQIMTKPTKGLCAQQRLRSAWASSQSDQSLR